MYDQFDDRSRKQLYGFYKVIDLPGFVKTAEASNPEEKDQIPSNCFADKTNGKYPVHTKKDTYLSRLYFTKNKDMYKNAALLEEVSENINKASEFWGLDKDYTVKEMLTKTAYHLPIVDYQGGQIDEWILNTPRDFEKAAIQIFENKEKFTYPQRRKLARTMLNIPLQKEASLTEEVSEYLEKAAGYGMCTRKQVLTALADRAALYNRKNPELSEKLAEAADTLTESKVTPTILHKIACVLDICDDTSNCARFYHKDILDTPEETLFRFTEKRASEIKKDYINLQNGKSVALIKLAEDKVNQFFTDYLGEMPEGDMSEKLAVISSLPSPDADALLNFIED